MYMHNNHCQRVTANLQLNILLLLLLLLLFSTCFESLSSIVRKPVVIIQALWYNACPYMYYRVSHKCVHTLDLQSKLLVRIFTLFYNLLHVLQ